MTEQEIKATLQDMANLLAGNLKIGLDAASGPKLIQVVHRQLCTTEDLKSSDLLVAKAADDIRVYLAAWPNVDGLKSTAEFTTDRHTRIYHQETIIQHYPMPGFLVHHASAPTSAGRVDAILLWNNTVLTSELAFSVTCSVSA